MRSRRFGIELIGLVASGGAAGTVARAAVEQAGPAGVSAFPWATLAVNLGGSLVLGLVIGTLERSAPSRRLRLLLGTGLCGGFTTFSTFAVEFDSLIRAGRVAFALLYATVSVLAGLIVLIGALRITRLRSSREV